MNNSCDRMSGNEDDEVVQVIDLMIDEVDNNVNIK